MEIMALCALCLAIGTVCGYFIAMRYERRKDVAPLPDFDPKNPVNAKAWEPVEMGGATWYRVN